MNVSVTVNGSTLDPKDYNITNTRFISFMNEIRKQINTQSTNDLRMVK